MLTLRSAGKSGVAITFLGNEDADTMYDLKQMLSKSQISRVPEGKNDTLLWSTRLTRSQNYGSTSTLNRSQPGAAGDRRRSRISEETQARVEDGRFKDMKNQNNLPKKKL